MSLGASQAATLNIQLTDFAVGHMQDLEGGLALGERICPTVRVSGTHGQFKRFDDTNAFQTYNTARALGGDPAVIEFGADDLYFNTKPQALEVKVDEEERRMAGNPNGQDGGVANQLLDEGKIKALLNAAILSSVKKRVDFVLSKVTPQDKRGNWSNPDIDPVDQLDEQIDLLLGDVGSTGAIAPLKVTMDLGSWRTLRSHPLVKKRLTGVQVSEISIDQLKAMLLVPVDLEIVKYVFIDAKPGQQAAAEKTGKKRILAGNVLIHIDSANPTIYDPSAFKAFTVGDSMITGVRSYLAPSGLYGGHFVDWSEDLQQTSTLSMRRLQIS
jgi:hypothetical protein